MNPTLLKQMKNKVITKKEKSKKQLFNKLEGTPSGLLNRELSFCHHEGVVGGRCSAPQQVQGGNLQKDVRNCFGFKVSVSSNTLPILALSNWKYFFHFNSCKFIYSKRIEAYAKDWVSKFN